MESYVKDYYSINKNKYNRGGFYSPEVMEFWLEGDVMMEDSVDEADSVQAKSLSANDSWTSTTGWNSDYSKTNTQVDWVDESDIIKTDWKHVYYYNQTQKLIYIIEAYWSEQMKVLKKITLPKSFNSPVMYIWNNKLIILATGYVNNKFSSNYYINRSNRTYTIVYDVTSKTEPKLEKLYINDWSLRKSRKIGKYVYVISSNNFNFPYHTYNSEDDIDINIGSVLPKKLEISKTDSASDQNLKIKWKSLPYNLKAGNIAKCSDIEYSLPDKETMKNFNFNPSYNIISIINVEDSEAEVKTKVVAWNSAEVYMSLDNLYLTESMYQSKAFSCPDNARCIMPMYWGWTQNTVLHKMNVTANSLKYQDSTIIPWRPLNQYSMDEKDTDFRIITSTNNWWPEREQHTDFYILDKNLKFVSSVNNLGEWENFQSSRFMWDKLFLVTFKQVDPFYVIDLEDRKNPEVIGELKIPGYSTYLHPYDENHLIGLWFDTYEWSNGWTRQWGLKVDLYEINYDKKWGISSDCSKYKIWECPSYCIENKIWWICETKKDDSKEDYIEVKQKYTKTFGDNWSSSEATRNPRMFMWNAAKNTLLLPATLYTRLDKESYKTKDYFQWLLNLKIDVSSGIEEKYRVSHIDYTGLEEKRKQECSKYSLSNAVPVCRKLIDGSEYCSEPKKQYVPEYCYADSSVWSYLASRQWNYRSSFVKRALWVWDNVYSISDAKILQNDLTSGKEKTSLDMK